MSAKHTATPYYLGTEYPSAYVRDLMTEGGLWTEINAKNHFGFAFIVTGMTDGDGSDEAKATAEFLVRAANNHAPLAQALKDCLELLRGDGYTAASSATVADAETALAAAGVQP